MSPFSPDMLLLLSRLLPPERLQRHLQSLTDLSPLRTSTAVEGKTKKTGRRWETKFPSQGKLEVSHFLLVGQALEISHGGCHHPLGCCWAQRGHSTPDYARYSACCAGRKHRQDTAAGI